MSSSSSIERALQALVPPFDGDGDWDEILRRAATARGARRIILFAAAALIVVAVPLIAVAASRNWWFLGQGPKPTSSPVVVKVETWEGRRWQIVAYPSETDGLCFGVAPIRGSLGAGMVCAPFAVIPRTSHTKDSPDLTITFLAGSGASGPSYVVGPVVGSADHVEIVLADGRRVRLPTFVAPPPLGDVRFYAAEIALPRSVLRPRWSVAKLVGRDARGKIVACLVPGTATDGVSPLSDCR